MAAWCASTACRSRGAASTHARRYGASHRRPVPEHEPARPTHGRRKRVCRALLARGTASRRPIGALLDDLGIGHRGRARPAQLSGGELAASRDSGRDGERASACCSRTNRLENSTAPPPPACFSCCERVRARRRGDRRYAQRTRRRRGRSNRGALRRTGPRMTLPVDALVRCVDVARTYGSGPNAVVALPTRPARSGHASALPLSVPPGRGNRRCCISSPGSRRRLQEPFRGRRSATVRHCGPGRSRWCSKARVCCPPST